MSVKNDEQKAGLLESLLQHPGWSVLCEDLNARKTTLLNQLASNKRPAEVTDDFIRGRVDMANFVLTGYAQIVKIAKAQKFLDGGPDGENLPAIGSPFDPAGIDSQPDGE